MKINSKIYNISQRPNNNIERKLVKKGYIQVAGIDEVGLGSLAGPIVTSAVILPLNWKNNYNLKDSKKLTILQRKKLAQIITQNAICWSVDIAQSEEIDKFNIHQANHIAMYRVIKKLKKIPHFLLIDGYYTIKTKIPQLSIIKGDATCNCIAAASILAKIHRDHLMTIWHYKYPHYNFISNKGYSTNEHRESLKKHGPCPIHRRYYTFPRVLKKNINYYI